MALKEMFKRKKKGLSTSSGEKDDPGSNQGSAADHSGRTSDATSRASGSSRAPKIEEENGSASLNNGSSQFREQGSSSLSIGTQNSESADHVPALRPLARNRPSIAQLKHDKGVSESFVGMSVSHRFGVTKFQATPAMSSLSEAYDAIPEIEQTKLPRGGISIETKAVGRVQVSGSNKVL